MTTVADLVASTRVKAYGTMIDQVNIISANAVSGATELTMQLPVSTYETGTLLCSGLNTWLVIGTSGASTVRVIPGFQGSPQAAVTAGDLVWVQPKATDWQIFGHLNDALAAMSAPDKGLYRTAVWDISVNNFDSTYPIPAEILVDADGRALLSIIGARIQDFGSGDEYFDIDASQIHWQDGQNIVRVAGSYPSGLTLSFTIKTSFARAAALTDTIADLGLAESMSDIPTLFATGRLLRTTESRRNQVAVQSDSRKAAEVQQRGNAAAADDFMAEFKQRCNAEYLRLQVRNPARRSV